MESMNWGPGAETLEGLGDLKSFSGKSESWTRLLVRKIKERLNFSLKWQLGEEEEEHLYDDLEEELHPDVKIYFAYLQRYC